MFKHICSCLATLCTHHRLYKRVICTKAQIWPKPQKSPELNYHWSIRLAVEATTRTIAKHKREKGSSSRGYWSLHNHMIHRFFLATTNSGTLAWCPQILVQCPQATNLNQPSKRKECLVRMEWCHYFITPEACNDSLVLFHASLRANSPVDVPFHINRSYLENYVNQKWWKTRHVWRKCSLTQWSYLKEMFPGPILNSWYQIFCVYIRKIFETLS